MDADDEGQVGADIQCEGCDCPVKVRLSDEAQRDIDALYAYYEARHDAGADRIVAALLSSLRGKIVF